MWVEFVVGSRPCSERFFSGYSGFPLSSKTNISRNLKKAELISELQQRGLPSDGTVQVLQDRLNNFLKNLEKSYKDQNVDLTKVHPSQNLECSSIAKASDSILVASSDVEKAIYMITLEMDGVVVNGSVTFFSNYPNGCEEVISMCANDNILYVSHKGKPGGVTTINMSDLTVNLLLRNGTVHCSESSHVAPYRNGILFVDTEDHQIKAKFPSEDVIVIAGSRKEGNSNGKAEDACFSQPMGICVECDKNIFVTHAQTGSVKLITTIKGMVEFLRHLGLLYKAFSVHLKHQTVAKLSLDEAIKHLETLNNFLKESVGNVMTIFDKPCKPSGAMGTVSSQTLSSVGMILDGLRALQQLLKELNPSYEVDLHTCLTVQVENLHAMGHFKDQFPTLLEYARNLANTVYESIKRVVQWAAYYYTHEKSYYPVVPQATPLNALPRMGHLKATRKLSDRERDVMLEWASNNGKAVRQRTVRQETTMFKAGTLPLNMYATSVQPKEKLRIERRAMDCPVNEDADFPTRSADDGGDKQSDDPSQHKDDLVEVEERLEQGADDSEFVEQSSEYDTESDSEPTIVGSDNEDEMTFLRAVTRSGRTVRVTSKLF